MEQETRHTLTVTSHEKAGVTVVKIKGSLAATTAEQGNREMEKILNAGAKKLILNLAEVDYISSGGIRVIMLAFKVLQGVQGQMKLSSAKGMVKEALQASGFDLLSRMYGGNLQLYSTDEEALAAFNS
ncbi:MAG: STAS domain-containing protein [Nitrospira sp.]|nr:STAS domain-containing protein [Nitrospira sp.]